MSGTLGMRSRASGAARLEASSCCFSERAFALSELRLFPISLTRCSPFSDVRCRIAQERVPTNLTCDAGSRGERVPPMGVVKRGLWAQRLFHFFKCDGVALFAVMRKVFICLNALLRGLAD